MQEDALTCTNLGKYEFSGSIQSEAKYNDIRLLGGSVAAGLGGTNQCGEKVRGIRSVSNTARWQARFSSLGCFTIDLPDEEDPVSRETVKSGLRRKGGGFGR